MIILWAAISPCLHVWPAVWGLCHKLQDIFLCRFSSAKCDNDFRPAHNTFSTWFWTLHVHGNVVTSIIGNGLQHRAALQNSSSAYMLMTWQLGQQHMMTCKHRLQISMPLLTAQIWKSTAKNAPSQACSTVKHKEMKMSCPETWLKCYTKEHMCSVKSVKIQSKSMPCIAFSLAGQYYVTIQGHAYTIAWTYAGYTSVITVSLLHCTCESLHTTRDV